MEIVELILEGLIFIGVLFNIYYQIQKMKSLETQIKSQKGILESAETFMKFFDLDKLRGYADIREENIKVQKEVEIKKIMTDLDERMKKEENTRKSVAILLKEYNITMNAFYDAFSKLPNVQRREVVNHMGEGNLKEEFKNTVQQLELLEDLDQLNLKYLDLAIKSRREEEPK